MRLGKRATREVMKVLHGLASKTADGDLVLDPKVVRDKLAALDLPAESKDDERDEDERDENEDAGDGGYDAVKDGKAAAAREIGERVARDRDAFR